MGKRQKMDGSGGSSYSATSSNDESEVDEKSFVGIPGICWNVVRDTFKLGVPIIIGAASKMLQVFIISVMLGRRDTTLLAAVSVSAIWTSWVDEMLRAGHGQVAALCGQAYGAGKYEEVGIWLQIGLAFTTILFPPLAMLRFFTYDILAFLGVPEAVAQPAGIFTVWSAGALIFELWYSVINKYYYAQSIVLPDAVISIVYIVIAAVLVWFFVYYYDWGVYGLAIALSIKRIMRTLTLVGYCWWMGYHQKTWKGWQFRELFNTYRWTTVLGQAIPAMLGAIAEEAHWQLSALFAARLGPVKSASFDLLMCVAILFYAFVWGLSQGTGILMARHLGQCKPKRSRGVVRVGVFLVYGCLITLSALMYVLNEPFVQLVSTDPLVQQQIRDLRLIASVNMVASGGLILMSEILMKQARPGLVFITMTPCNWLIGLPIAFILSQSMGLMGIFVGHLCGYSLGHIVLGTLVWRSDWNELAKKARMQAKNAAAQQRAPAAAEDRRAERHLQPNQLQQPAQLA